MTAPLRVGIVQHDIAWEDAPATRSALEPRIAEAAGAGAGMVVLTEMFATGFSMHTDVTVEPVGGPTATWMHDQASRHGLWLAGSIPTRDPEAPGADGRPVNRFHLVGPSGQQTTYDKIHTFTYADESDHFAAGTEPVTVEVEGWRLTLTICFDLRFADLYWDAAAGTDAYLVVANWPATRREHWRALLRARAIENQAWVVAANRVGKDGNGLGYLGDSAVIDPLGETIAEASRDEALLVADLDPDRVTWVRDTLPFHADRR